MRSEGHGWDPKAPACVISCRAGHRPPTGDISGWYYRARGFSGWDVAFNAADPKDTLVGQLTRWPKGDLHNFGVPGESYAFPDAVKYWETIAPFLDRASPLRCSHMRAPQEPQLHFAHESFIDEVAAAAGRDPVALRLAHLRDEREIAVLRPWRRLANWQSRPSPATAAGGPRSSAGAACRCATVSAAMSRRCARWRWTGRRAASGRGASSSRTIAGSILNPRSLRTTIEGNIVQGVSRALFEEVRFDERNVRSVDWASYPILEMRRCAGAHRNRHDQPSGAACRRSGRARACDGAGCDRQCGVRRDGTATAPHADEDDLWSGYPRCCGFIG